MRNSFNTAGFSEVVHETRADPAEAWYGYIGRARWSPRRGLSARNGRAMLGTIKSTRRFTVDVADPCAGPAEAAHSENEPTPMDLALTGVGACSLKTMIGGGSARGIVYETAEMSISCDVGAPVVCQFEIDGSGDDRLMAELLDQVRRFSPNHATLTASVPLELRCSDGGGHDHHETVTDLGPSAITTPAARRIRWISGVQLESHPVAPAAGPTLRVDSPRQLTGVDWGPNPQEHMLMGLSADIAAHLGAVSAEHGHAGLTWDVSSDGGVDIRGMLQADPSVLVRVQGLSCTIHTAGTVGSTDDLRAIVHTALARSTVRRLICQPQTVSVSLSTPAPDAEYRARGRTAS